MHLSLDTLEIHAVLIRHSHWGKGYATEAAPGALDWAWRNVGTEHIISLITPDDLASIRIAEKLGERFEREILMNDVNHHMYGIKRRNEPEVRKVNDYYTGRMSSRTLSADGPR